MPEPIVIAAYDPAWRDEFAAVAQRIRVALRDVALRIDHIGSTAVPGLDAKPIVDVQVSVAALEPHSAFSAPLQACGFVFRTENPERTKRYFREQPGERRTHVHVRAAGSFSEQFALLFRDYLRNHPQRAAEYAALKHVLASRFRDDRQGYAAAKDDFVWKTIRQADDWAQATGWAAGPSDA